MEIPWLAALGAIGLIAGVLIGCVVTGAFLLARLAVTLATA